jgi:hypothetical protein
VEEKRALLERLVSVRIKLGLKLMTLGMLAVLLFVCGGAPIKFI